MHELTDSTPLRYDGQALRARLAQHGYLLLRGVLPAADVAQVRTGVAAALTSAGWLAGSATTDCPVPTPLAVREGGPGYVDAYLGIQRLQAFHELAHTAALRQLMDSIIGDQLLVHPRKIARTSLPCDDEYTPPHQDFRLIQGSVDALTCWVPLGDCPVALGGLRMLEGSHRDGLLAADASSGPGGLTIDVQDDDPAWRTTDYRAGDVIVFTSLTVHGALRNNADVLRFSADFRYQPVHEPVVAGSLLPHYYPQIPAWEDLTQGWTDRRSVLAPAGVRVVEQQSPLDPGLQAAPSRLLALA